MVDTMVSVSASEPSRDSLEKISDILRRVSPELLMLFTHGGDMDGSPRSPIEIPPEKRSRPSS